MYDFPRNMCDIDDISKAKGPIVQYVDVGAYQNSLHQLSKQTGLELSSHSMRRTGSQWAARCGANYSVIRNVGRWKDLKIMFEYIAKAQLDHQEACRAAVDGIDPVTKFWFFEPYTGYDAIILNNCPVN